MLLAVADKIEETPEFPLYEETEEARVVYKHEKKEEPFIITRADDGVFELAGAELERLFKMTERNECYE